MILSPAIILAIEAAFNQYLTLDGESLEQFASLSDKVICLHITGLDIRLYFLPNQYHIQILSQYSGTPDTTIAAPPMTLFNLSNAENAGKYMLSSSTTITGNTGVGMHFSHVLRQVDIHWEDHLSYFVGDIIAQQGSKIAHHLSSQIKNNHKRLIANAAEYLTEEKKLIPTAVEVNSLITHIDELREHSDRINQRIKHLEKKYKINNN